MPESAGFPKGARILKPGDFRKIYDNGVRVTGPFFAAFCLVDPKGTRPRFGFTVPRAVGKAVDRNAIRRRLREAVRLVQHQFAPNAQVIFNPRRPVLLAAFDDLRKEVSRVASRFAQLSVPKDRKS